ncbi:uncharacterized protein LOC135226948 [Macrobrachium nipponense]|uniref:uncharacterized protein LOC135226948 n=1 Tax=Macrobrachium nipponense TaxID=159736 RepID=UPI0030C8CE2D
MASFRDLLKKPLKKKVYWDDQLQQEFEKAGSTICQLAKEGLIYHDKSRPMAAVTDWCRAVMYEVKKPSEISAVSLCEALASSTDFDSCKQNWPAKTGYAAVMGEALVVVWCLKKVRLFLLGCPNLTMVTDHCPLVKLFGNRELKDISNPRLFRLKKKTLQYHFSIKYLPGKRNSRYPSLRAKPEDEDLELSDDLMVAMVTSLVAALEVEDVVAMDQETVLSATRHDPVYQLLLTRVYNVDWPQKRLVVSGELITYTYDQGCVRLVIPESLRQQVAANMHSGHQGLDSSQEGPQHERLIMMPPAEYPFQQVVVDLFQIHGCTYLAFADRLTGWVEVAHLANWATSEHLIKKFRGILSDGMPQRSWLPMVEPIC